MLQKHRVTLYTGGQRFEYHYGFSDISFLFLSTFRVEFAAMTLGRQNLAW